jgi:alanyl-tRNA synthetase
LANSIVYENRPVSARFVSEAELKAIPLRKPPAVTGSIRIVTIDHFDFSACGGTHVASTGEVGLIEVLKTERLKKGVRIEFVCGGRARADYARKHSIIRDLSTALTCAPGELPESVARLQDALGDARRRLTAYRERELDQEAAALIASAHRSGSLRIVRSAWSDRPIDEVKALVLRITSEPGLISLFGVAGTRAQILFGRSEGVALELKPVFDRTLAALGGGKGGGTRLLQGAAGAANLEAIERALDAAQAAVSEAVT